MDGSAWAQTPSRSPCDHLRFWYVDAGMYSPCCCWDSILCKCPGLLNLPGRACLFLRSVPYLPVWGLVCKPTSETVLQPRAHLCVLQDLRVSIHSGGSHSCIGICTVIPIPYHYVELHGKRQTSEDLFFPFQPFFHLFS